ncbi:HAMP domain-containing sensor histidine kinase [uncultured Tateyamaria sp.]|uniref:sensor histidine kinase n=1 Tax=uncultured Tateyamaria sp. TaxID=455651 RepID=UPI00262C70E5|nr:HAMP domain-containing sensor histidine kinase [uncultured Tateyamaria sp.]
MLFYVTLAAALILTTAFCLSVYVAAQRADRQMVQTIEAQLLRVLEEDGISGLAAAFDTARTVVQPGADRLDVALWQKRGDTERLLLETAPGIAAAFQAGTDRIRHDDIGYRLQIVDVATAARDWPLPMSDVALTFGLEAPTLEMRRAYRTIAIIVALSLSVCAFMAFLQGLHWQHYRRSVARINALLDRYSRGETGIRFEDETPSPELRELGGHLNVVLPRLDALFEDLRALSAHLAHELRTPLQTIRSGVRKVVRESDSDARADLARSIDQNIDGADARLQTVMQLFRLQADAEVTMTPGVALGAVLEDLCYDFEHDIEQQERRLVMDIDPAPQITGNTHLLELMISNLLSNAAKYASPRSDVHVHLSAQDGRFELRVTNTATLSHGFGETAFDRYAQGQGHGSLTGHGLGLALVQAIADKHGLDASFGPDPTDPSQVTATLAGKIEMTA